MTRQTLNDVIYTSKKELLGLNSIYVNKALIGSKFSMSRQIELLRAIDIYLDILEYYYDVMDVGQESLTSIESGDIDNVVELVVQCISSFKKSYYA